MTMRQIRHPLVRREWLARHGGRGQMITVVFRSDLEAQLIYIALIAFGGRNWLTEAVGRRSFPD